MPKCEIKGYRGILENRGKFVDAEEALDYALKQMGLEVTNPTAPEAELLPEIVEWYFSGNWIAVHEGEDE